MNDPTPRLAPLTPDALEAGARALFDAVLASPRGQGPARRIIQREDGSLTGPFDAWLRTPELGIHLERAGMALRTATGMSDAVREVTVLVVAKAWRADFEWWVHGLVARRHGVSEEVIDAIAHGQRPDFDDAACAAAYQVAIELVYDRRLTRASLDGARNDLGERALIEVVTLVGFYQLVSGVLESFQPPAPSPDLPVVGPPESPDPPRSSPQG